jgi:hypothetical protein
MCPILLGSDQPPTMGLSNRFKPSHGDAHPRLLLHLFLKSGTRLTLSRCVSESCHRRLWPRCVHRQVVLGLACPCRHLAGSWTSSTSSAMLVWLCRRGFAETCLRQRDAQQLNSRCHGERCRYADSRSSSYCMFERPGGHDVKSSSAVRLLNGLLAQPLQLSCSARMPRPTLSPAQWRTAAFLEPQPARRRVPHARLPQLSNSACTPNRVLSLARDGGLPRASVRPSLWSRSPACLSRCGDAWAARGSTAYGVHRGWGKGGGVVRV